MNRVVIPIAIVAVAAAVLALWPAAAPKPVVDEPSPEAATRESEASAETPEGQEPITTSKGQRPGQKTPPRASGPVLHPALPPNTSPIPTEITVRSPARVGKGMAEFQGSEFKASVARFYNGIPKRHDGLVPGAVIAEDVLPLALLDELGIPGTSRITHFGHYPAHQIEGFKELMERYDGESDMPWGVTFQTPDGANIREYIRLTALKK